MSRRAPTDDAPVGVAAPGSRFYTLTMADESDTESRFQALPGRPISGPTATLASTRIGRGGRVHDVRGEDAISLRLLEMGLTPGVPVRVVAQAPLGDPLEVEVRGYRLSIRRAEAARVAVDPD